MHSRVSSRAGDETDNGTATLDRAAGWGEPQSHVLTCAGLSARARRGHGVSPATEWDDAPCSQAQLAQRTGSAAARDSNPGSEARASGTDSYRLPVGLSDWS